MKNATPGGRVGSGAAPIAGLAGWLLARVRDRLSRGAKSEPRLALVERISLAPRQSLALVEAEGRLLLVATSAEGAPAFYALDGMRRRADAVQRKTVPRDVPGRISW
jgi:flagellar biogenesis protein FliO